MEGVTQGRGESIATNYAMIAPELGPLRPLQTGLAPVTAPG